MSIKVFNIINNSFDSINEIKSTKTKVAIMIIMIIFSIFLVVIGAHTVYEFWYGKVLFYSLIIGILVLILFRIMDAIKFRHSTLINKIKRFWIYLEVIEEKVIEDFKTDDNIVFMSVNSVISHLNSDPILKKFLLDYYEPLEKIDFKQTAINDNHLLLEYHSIFFDMLNQKNLRDNLIIEAQKL